MATLLTKKGRIEKKKKILREKKPRRKKIKKLNKGLKMNQREQRAKKTLEMIVNANAEIVADAKSVDAIIENANLDFVNYLEKFHFQYRDPKTTITYNIGGVGKIVEKKNVAFKFNFATYNESKVNDWFIASSISNKVNFDLILSVYTIIKSISTKASKNFLFSLLFEEMREVGETMTVANIDYFKVKANNNIKTLTIQRQYKNTAPLSLSDKDPKQEKLKIYKSSKLYYYNNDYAYLKIPDDWVFIPKGNRSLSIAINKFPCWKLQKKRSFTKLECDSKSGTVYKTPQSGYNTCGYFISSENLKAALELNSKNARERSLASFRRDFRKNYAYYTVEEEFNDDSKELLRKLEINMSK
jgi:hypothetical protein